MNPSNAGAADANAVRVQASRGVELAMYDAMPRLWRDLVDSLPIAQSVAKIEEYRAALGDDAAYARVVSTFRSKYPGWVPPDGAPAPVWRGRRGRRYRVARR